MEISVNGMLHMRMQLSWLQQQARDYLVGGHFLISVRFQ
jgi:hypothetical protein